MKITIIQTILKLNPTAQVSISEDNISTLVWHDNNPTNITNQQILAKQSELQELEDVYDNRRKEYRTWESQLHQS